MDPLQLVLILLILLLTGFLSVMGIQVFLILKDLRGELNKIDKILILIEHQNLNLPQSNQVTNLISDAQSATNTIKPTRPLSESKQPRRFFKRKFGL